MTEVILLVGIATFTILGAAFYVHLDRIAGHLQDIKYLQRARLEVEEKRLKREKDNDFV